MRIVLIFLILNCTSLSAQVQNSPKSSTPELSLQEMNSDSMILFLNCPAAFIGGVDSLKSFIHFKMIDVNMNWVDSIYKKRGRVAFIVEKDGSLMDIQIYQSVSPEIDAVMISMVEEMPFWQPACDQNGPCRERVLLPVSFIREQ